MTVGFTNGSMNKSLFILTCFITIFMIGCRNDLHEIKAIDNDKVLPVSTTSNVEMIYSDSSVMKARIKAKLRETYMNEPSYVEFSKGISMEFYGPTGKVTSRLTAGHAISYNAKEIMEARNNVIVTNDKGERLNTEHLIWDRKANRIYSDVFTTVTSPDKVIYGEGFESEGDFSKYKIRNIKGSVRLKH